MSILNYTLDGVSAFFLICLGIGLFSSVGSLLLGAHHGGGHADFGHGNSGAHHVGSVGHGGAETSDGNSENISVFNLSTIFAFLMGFGAFGLVVKQVTTFAIILVLFAAIVGGIVFGYIVYFVLAEILIKGQTDYLKSEDLVGVEGTVTTTVFENSIGEMNYLLNGSYNVKSIRSRDGKEIKKDTLVIVIEEKDYVAIVVTKEDFQRNNI